MCRPPTPATTTGPRSPRRLVVTVQTWRSLVPRGARDLDAEVDVGADALLVGDLAHVGPDLLLAREALAPVGVELVREGVHVARDVALAAGVGVVAPGAADVMGLLEDDEVLAAGVAQLHGHAHAGEAGADDDDVLRDHVSDTIGIWNACKGVRRATASTQDGSAMTVEETRPVSRAERQAQTRESLIEVAREMFLADGYAATSLDKVALKAGFSKGAVYSNFAGKEELCMAVLDSIHEEQIDGVVTAFTQDTDLDGRIEAFAAWAREGLGQPRWTALEVEFAAIARQSPYVAAELVKRHREISRPRSRAGPPGHARGGRSSAASTPSRPRRRC